MADSTNARPVGEEAGPLERALRATSAGVDSAQTWRDYYDHTTSCTACRTAGVNCEAGIALKQAWLDARTP